MRYNPPVDCPVEQEDGTVFWTFEMVEERLVEAVEFLDRVVANGRFPFAKDGPWSQVMRDRLVDYVDVDDLRERGARVRGGLRAAEVDRMEETLNWIRFVPARANLRRLVGCVAIYRSQGGSQVDWLEVKRRMATGDSPDALRMAYSRCIQRICQRLSH